jgi:hypothetical protein
MFRMVGKPVQTGTGLCFEWPVTRFRLEGLMFRMADNLVQTGTRLCSERSVNQFRLELGYVPNGR